MEKVYVRFRVPRTNTVPSTHINKVIFYLDANCILLSNEDDREFSTKTRRYNTFGGAVVELESSPSRSPDPDNPRYEISAEFFVNQRKARKSLELIAKSLGLTLDSAWDEIRRRVE